MKQWLLKLFGKQPVEVELDNRDKVEQARNQIEFSLGMFKTINEEIEEANATLSQVIEEDARKVKELEQNIDIANGELQANESLQEKVKQFIK